MLGAVLLFLQSGFLWPFLLVFSLLLRAFLVPFLALGAGRRAALFAVGLFVAVFACVFSSFAGFFGAFFGTGCWAAVLLFLQSGFLWPFLLVFSLLLWAFFKKAILLFLSFWLFFGSFHFSFDLPQRSD